MPYIIDQDIESQFQLLAKQQGEVAARETLVSLREESLSEREKKVWAREKKVVEENENMVVRENNVKEKLRRIEELKGNESKERQDLNEFRLSLATWHKKLCNDAEKINQNLCLLRKERFENDRIVRDMCDQQAILNSKIEFLESTIRNNKESEDNLDKKIVEFEIEEKKINAEIKNLEEERIQLIERRKGLDAKERNLNDYKRILDIKAGELKAKELSNEKNIG